MPKPREIVLPIAVLAIDFDVVTDGSLVQAPIERELRNTMKREEIAELLHYPEQRYSC
jgi:hypothetical protein